MTRLAQELADLLPVLVIAGSAIAWIAFRIGKAVGEGKR